MRAFQLEDSYYHCCLGGPGCHGTGRGKTLAFSLALVIDREEIIVIISPLSSLMIEQMVNTYFHCGYMPQDLIEGLSGYIKGPSYFKHFLIGTIWQ